MATNTSNSASTPATPGKGEGDPEADAAYRASTKAFVKSGDVQGAASRAADAVDGAQASELRAAEKAGKARAAEFESDHASLEERLKRLVEIVNDFDTAMVVTEDSDGRRRGRPMSIASVATDGTLLFFTGANTSLAKQAPETGLATVTMQSRGSHVCISGPVSVGRDQALIDAHWSDAMDLWFEGGKEDPSLRTVKVHVRHADLWNVKGSKVPSMLFDIVRAKITGDTVKAHEWTERSSVGHLDELQ